MASKNDASQTSFNSMQELASPPPELTKASAAKNKKIFMASLAVVSLVLVSVAAALLLKPPVAEEPAQALPTPSPLPRNTQLEKDIQTLQEAVDASQPVKAVFPPPAVDMKVEF